MSSNQNISGIVVNKDGVHLIGIIPVEDGDNTIGAIEVSQSIHSLKIEFERLGKEFIFVLNKTQLVFLDIAHKENFQWEESSKKFYLLGCQSNE